MDSIVLFTGGFDPIHSGHIEVIKEAQTLGRVIIGVNSDDWLIRKKNKPFMNFEERKTILQNIKGVITVVEFDDSDDTAVDAILKVKKIFPRNKIIFVNGGDRNHDNVPEQIYFKDDPAIEFKFGVGGSNKKNSSSWLLKDWKSPQTKRIWGEFLEYYQSENVKVKRLIIEPSKSISMQYHEKRSEFWFIEDGEGLVHAFDEHENSKAVKKHDIVNINPKQWHKLENVGTDNLYVIEIQYGEKCIEEDIIRR